MCRFTYRGALLDFTEAGSNFEGQLFFDESNNFRKLIIKQNSFNKDNWFNFVLGGIGVHKDSPCNEELTLTKIKQKLHLDKDIKEIKTKHISKKGFIPAIKEKRTTKILKLFIQNNFFFHFFCIDPYYWSSTDIIDSICDYNNEQIYEVKELLYRIVKQNTSHSANILYQHNYPNLTKKDAKNFYNDISNLIQKTKLDDCDNKLKKKLIELFSNRGAKDIAFISNETNFTPLGSLLPFYIDRIISFPNASLCFDEEIKIQKELNKDKSFKEEHLNYEFKNSKENIRIQFSDIAVGILAKFFDYLAQNSTPEIKKQINTLGFKPLANIFNIYKLINDGGDYRFNKFIAPISLVEKYDIINSFVIEKIKKKSHNI